MPFPTALQTLNPELATKIGRITPILAERAAGHDRHGTFVDDNYRTLQDAGLFGVGVPSELGGGGATHATRQRDRRSDDRRPRLVLSPPHARRHPDASRWSS